MYVLNKKRKKEKKRKKKNTNERWKKAVSILLAYFTPTCMNISILDIGIVTVTILLSLFKLIHSN
jgi:hypothetical protein